MVRKSYACTNTECGKIMSVFKHRDDELIPACDACGCPTVRDYTGTQISMPHIHAPGGLKDWGANKTTAEKAEVYLNENVNPY